MGYPTATQDSLPGAGQALLGGLDYPQGSDERFQNGLYISSPFPKLSLARIMLFITHIESTPLAGDNVAESTTTRNSQQGAALMKRSTKYVGLDVHQASTVSSVREEG